MNAEHTRIQQNNSGEQRWHLWGPYVAERQWGTVREDYSANGDAWTYLSHDQARSRAYRWGDDGLAGISDYKQRLCFGWAFWLLALERILLLALGTDEESRTYVYVIRLIAFLFILYAICHKNLADQSSK